jgi:hypothetical protein
MSDRVQKGDFAEQAVIKDLLKRKYKVAKPIGTDWRFDLILYRNNMFERIQVKWCESDEDKLSISCRSTSYSSIIHYTDRDIDWIAAYDERSDKCFYLPATVLGPQGRAAVQLRFKSPSHNNGHSSNLLYAKDFENI